MGIFSGMKFLKYRMREERYHDIPLRATDCSVKEI